MLISLTLNCFSSNFLRAVRLKRTFLAAAIPMGFVGLALSSCDDTVHPFQPEAKPLPPELAAYRAEPSLIVVLPVVGLPQPLDRDLAKAMAATLEENSLPAVIENKLDGQALYSVNGRFLMRSPGPGTPSVMTWEVRNEAGSLVGRHSQILPLGSDPFSPATRAKLIADIDSEAGPIMVKGIEGDAPIPSDDNAAFATAVRASPRHSIVVTKIEGTPVESGDLALRQAIEYALRVAKVKVVSERASDSLMLAAKIESAPMEKNKEIQRVKVTWTVERANGKALGQVSQENNVPTRLLEREWSEIANAVAQAAAGGIASLVAEADLPSPAEASPGLDPGITKAGRPRSGG